MAVGMNFLHTNNPPIIHRDLKSLKYVLYLFYFFSILLTEQIERPTDNTKIKISDFGLSKIIKSFDSSREQMTGQLGTCVTIIIYKYF
jgi:serine/threonine protein kinase